MVAVALGLGLDSMQDEWQEPQPCSQKVLEESASQTAQALSAGARRLVTWIRQREAQDPKTSAAVAMVSADPTDQDSIDMLSGILAGRVAGDHEMARQLHELAADTPEAVFVRDQAQVGMIISGSSIGGQGGHGPAAGGGDGGGVIPIIREDGLVELIGQPAGGPGESPPSTGT